MPTVPATGSAMKSSEPESAGTVAGQFNEMIFSHMPAGISNTPQSNLSFLSSSGMDDRIHTYGRNYPLVSLLTPRRTSGKGGHPPISPLGKGKGGIKGGLGEVSAELLEQNRPARPAITSLIPRSDGRSDAEPSKGNHRLVSLLTPQRTSGKGGHPPISPLGKGKGGIKGGLGEVSAELLEQNRPARLAITSLIPRSDGRSDAELSKGNHPPVSPLTPQRTSGKGGHPPISPLGKGKGGIKGGGGEVGAELLSKPQSLMGANLVKFQISNELSVSSESARAGEVLNKEQNKGLLLTGASIKAADISLHVDNRSNIKSFTEVQHMTKHPEVNHLYENRSVITKGNITSMKISLEPEGIGKLDIELVLHKGMINGHINTSDILGKAVLERNLNSIIDTLIKDGLSISGFSVSLRDKGGEKKGNAREEDLKTTQLIKKTPMPIACSRNNMINIFV